ncbi:MAG: LysR family transcriptional regulator substrate-binding protein, partial [Desulfovibrio sp.]|nr:LysR family transcriptional regulator substrate-binding protein [Desulfovibrio sp.]
PHVSCQARFSDSERLAGLVRQRQIELAVLYLPLEGKEFDITPLRPQRLEAVFSPLLPPPPASEMHLADVCQWPLMIPRRWNGGGIYSILSRALQLYGLEPRIICFSQNSYVLLELLERLAAVAIIPQSETEGKRRLAQSYIYEMADPLTPAIVTLKDIWLSRPARKMTELLAEDYA